MRTLSFSSVRDWKRCRQLWHYRHVRKLRPKRQSVALRRGSWIHELLEASLLGKSLDHVFNQHLNEYESWPEEERALVGPMPNECLRIVLGWEKRWLTGRPLKTLAVELPFEVEIAGVPVKGRIDWIFEDDRGVWIAEHKSAWKQLPSESHRMFDLQTALYVSVAKKLGYDPVGVCFDYLRTKPPTPPKRLAKGGLSRAKRIDCDGDTYRQAVIDAGLDPIDYQVEIARSARRKFYDRKFLAKPTAVISAMERELAQVAKEVELHSEQPYRNLTKDCEKCDYQSICEAELLGPDGRFVERSEYTIKGEE